MTRLFAIARIAFIETTRQPIYTVLVLVTFGLLIMTLPLSNWSMGRGEAAYRETDQQFLVVSGLSTLQGAGLLIAAFSAAGVLSREIEEKTILTIISKPIPRALVVLGKFAGVAAALVLAFYLCSLVFLMTVRHGAMPTAADPVDWPVIFLGIGGFLLGLAGAVIGNYVFGWSFAGALVALETVVLTVAMLAIAFIGKGWTLVPFGEGIGGDVLLAMLLLLMSTLVFAAVAVTASTRAGQLTTLAICLGFAIVGLWSYHLFGRHAEQSILARLAYWLWPNLTYFYAMDAILQNAPVPIGYVGWAALYAACQVAAILAVGVVLFQTREADSQSSQSTAPQLVTLLAWLLRLGAVAVAIYAAKVLGNAESVVRVGGAVGLGLLAAVIWLLAGWFGRGKRTGLYVVVAANVVLLAAGVVALIPAFSTVPVVGGWPASAAVAALIAAGVVGLVVVLPKTRHHFGFLPGRAGRRSG
jgi:ABC-type transport system involved in multi-copper enzyme maturation permease subunit